MNSLSGIKVVDFSQFLSASYCSQILGDLGADIIKIERPGVGRFTEITVQNLLTGKVPVF